MTDACAACMRRTQLIGWLAGHIEQQWRLRRGRPQLLALPDEELLRWAGRPDVEARYAAFRVADVTERLRAAEVGAVCRCSDAYPAPLRDLSDPPAVLHFLGDLGLASGDGVAIVGARRASGYGLEVSRSLAAGIAAQTTVVSGMAMGVDSAAHAAALEHGRTIAVLATGADRPYPASATGLHRRIVERGCVVSELPPGTTPRRWAFPARNRIIAALSLGTVVVEGGERSGSLITADFAAELGRFVAAVPGPITATGAAGPLSLLKAGAELIRSPADLLELLAAAPRPVTQLVIGAGDRPARATVATPADLSPQLAALLERIENGEDSLADLTAGAPDGLGVATALGELEFQGLVRRVFGGRYIRALA
jgi:DNA processing protein